MQTQPHLEAIIPPRYVVLKRRELNNAPPFIASSFRVLIGAQNKKVKPLWPGSSVLYTSVAGWLLSSFFIGYIFTQFPGGLLAQWLGGKWVFGIGVGMTSLLTLLTPLAAFTNVWVLMALRVLEGIFEVSCIRVRVRGGRGRTSGDGYHLNTGIIATCILGL